MIEKQQKEIAARDAELVKKSQAAAKATATAVATLRAELTAEQQTQLDSIVAGFNQQLAIKDARLVQAEAMTRLEMAKVAKRDSLLDQMNQLNKDLAKQLTDETKRNKPNLTSKVITASGWIVAVFFAAKS